MKCPRCNDTGMVPMIFGGPDYPCACAKGLELERQRMPAVSGSVSSDDDPLVGFLYLLAREHLPFGELERTLDMALRCERADYTNGWCARWAEDAAARLRGER